ncbi:hypothetical protein P3X46_008404 [Hevea brasiliensis]|uniref:Myb/SANT-like DNA-binding domain-containing protein n=1 Tax=Hevea brasiliensis TaxID=3981 RepID=A0ABQ9MIH7_HEVBR|nr:hypothetical protein P3X46_008404 [Hevea brasiliensis]
MFEGIPDQFHLFITSRTSLPLPLSFPPLHGSSSASTATFSSFDPYSHNQQLPLHHHHQQRANFLHLLHQSSPPTGKNKDKEENNMLAMNLEIERERSLQESVDPWKLAELGFKRSAVKCKEKSEEESRYLTTLITPRIIGCLLSLKSFTMVIIKTLEIAVGKSKEMVKAIEEEDKIKQNVEEDSRIDQTVGNPAEGNGKGIEKSKSQKRKRQKKFEMFKGFCEDIISKIMTQQEEMHNKFLEDMVKRDEKKIAREEAWKKQEMDRINKELELRAQEQALAGDRQTTINIFLKKNSHHQVLILRTEQFKSFYFIFLGATANPNPTSQTNNQNKPEAPISTTIGLRHQNSSSSPTKNNPVIPTSMPENLAPENSSSTLGTSSSTSSEAPQTQNPNFFNSQSNPLSTETVQEKPTSDDKEDLGKRWPIYEVLALINLSCSLYNSNEDKETIVKAPLWERISQGMMELGYKRNAKRCKEKWENINKYFRKTKEVNNRRSVDSRTCPYFDQLSTLSNQGTLVAPIEGPEKLRLKASPKNHSACCRLISSSQNGSSNSTMHNVGDQVEKTVV